MIITAKYASRCPTCSAYIAVGAQVEWSRGEKARHAACASGTASSGASSTRRPARPLVTRCVGCDCALDDYQRRRGFRFCSQDCAIDYRMGGQSGYVNGVWHQGSDD